MLIFNDCDNPWEKDGCVHKMYIDYVSPTDIHKVCVFCDFRKTEPINNNEKR